MARVMVDTSGFESAVEGIIARATDARPALQAWGLHMVGSVKRNFQEQGRPNPWRPLKVNTLLARYTRGKDSSGKAGGRFAPNPHVFKQSKGRISAGKAGDLGDVGAVSTVAGMARSSKTGRVLRSRHAGLNKFAQAGMVFRRPALRAIMSGKILLDTGRLRGSISSELQGKAKVGIGTNVKYAGAHQYGAPGKGIAARPYLVIQGDDAEEFESLVAEWVRGDWGG